MRSRRDSDRVLKYFDAERHIPKDMVLLRVRNAARIVLDRGCPSKMNSRLRW